MNAGSQETNQGDGSWIVMERVAFRLILREGKLDEYKRMHDDIWPEMLEELKAAKIQNYTIWNSGDDLFGYYEVADLVYSNRFLANSPIVAKWHSSMAGIYYPDTDPVTGATKKMQIMFQFNLTD